MKPQKPREHVVAQLGLEKSKGENARVLRSQFEQLFVKVEQAYRVELVSKTRADGKIFEAAVWKLIALDDLAYALDGMIADGQIAESRLEGMKRTGGDS